MGINPRRKETWSPIITKLQRRLLRRHSHQVSMGGRISLLNIVLSNTPIHFISFYKVPKVVVNEIISTQRNFL